MTLANTAATRAKIRVESALLHILEETESLYNDVAATPDPAPDKISFWLFQISEIGNRRRGAARALSALLAEKEAHP